MGQVLGAALAVRRRRADREERGPASGPTGDPDWELSTATGSPPSSSALFGGFIVGLTSVGSGVFFGLTLLVIFPLRAHKVVGTDIFHAAVLLYVAGPRTGRRGTSTSAILCWLLLGSIPGVLVGGRLTLSIPEQRLRLLLAGVLGLAGIKLLDVPGSRGDRGRRALGGRGRAARLARTTQLDPLRRGRARRRPPLSSSVASRGDAHGLGELRHDRPRLPRGGGRVGAEIVGVVTLPGPDRPEPLGPVLVRRRRRSARRRAHRDARRQLRGDARRGPARSSPS